MRYYTNLTDKTDFASDSFLRISSVGVQKHVNFDVTVERNVGRRDYHILYVKSGKTTVFYEGQKAVLTQGNFVLYPPRAAQKYIFLAKDACESYWLHFSGKAVEEILAAAGLSGGICHAEFRESITLAFRDILKANTGDLDAAAALLSFLSRLGKHAAGKTDDDPFAKVVAAMAEDIPLAYNARRYASLCALSESRFAHKFKERKGVSPLHYFLSLKIERAKELLCFTDLSIGEISVMTGFENRLYFSRLFKLRTGLSPLHYKNNIKKEL